MTCAKETVALQRWGNSLNFFFKVRLKYFFLSMCSNKMRLLSTTSLKMVYRDATNITRIFPFVLPWILSLLVSPPGLGSLISSQSRDDVSWKARVVN